MRKTGYMCKTAWDYELGEASGGTLIYPSLKDLQKEKDCVRQCGIVRVEITLVEVLQEEKF